MKLSIILTSLLLSTSANAGIYKWTDANGQAHFSEKPAHAHAEQITVKPHKPNSADIAHTRERANNIRQFVTVKQEERQNENKRLARKERHLATSKQQCHSLKNQLKDMHQGRVRWYKLGQEGDRVYLSERDIQNKKDRLQNRIKNQCI
ncbi:MAG: DUF4124 domain-containing protein [Gammaproteobacteria bacterium]